MALLPRGICASLTPAVLDDVFKSDLTGADSVEIRLDYLKDPFSSIDASWSNLPVPSIAVCRREERGGRFKGSRQEELDILKAAVRNGAAAVDIDYRDTQIFSGAQVIASYHNFDETPADIEHHLSLACESPARIAKVATNVRTWADNGRLLKLMSRDWPRPVIISGMGELGQITRLIGPSRGSFLAYATTQQPSSRVAAPGQLSLSEMIDDYGFRRIRHDTKLIGIVGNPLGHSLSPLLHNRAFLKTGLNFAYLKLPAPDLWDFFGNAKAIGIHGISITMPYKITAMKYATVVSGAAREVGAINTLVNQDGEWVGHNTDIDGICAALASANFSAVGKRVVILGTGGAARAAVAALSGAKEIIVLSRSPRTHEGWPAWPAHVELDFSENLGKRKYDLLINATPVGMHPAVERSPVSGPIPADVVFDMVYNPPMTTLLQAAKCQGKTVISGTTMFLAQAARQFEIWTGNAAPPEVFTPEMLER
jgi:shikimate dehydrogenase/3-dehydroquinate dehydratase type I